MLHLVIPAKAGIQSFQAVADHLDFGFHRSDDFLRDRQLYTQGVLPACALHADREAVWVNCLLHPPLNPLPSREGKERCSHQGRGKREKFPSREGKKREISIEGGERKRETPIKGGEREMLPSGEREEVEKSL